MAVYDIIFLLGSVTGIMYEHHGYCSHLSDHQRGDILFAEAGEGTSLFVHDDYGSYYYGQHIGSNDTYRSCIPHYGSVNPEAILSVGAMLLIFKFILRPDMDVAKTLDLTELKNSVKPADKREKSIVAIFFMIVLLWVVPDLLKGVFPVVMGWISGFGTVMPPLLGTMLLCVFSADGKPLLSFKEGFESVPWPSLFMAASALALGSAMSNADIGLSSAVSRILVPITQNMSSIVLVLVLLALTAIMTNIGSNMVTITLVANVALPILLKADAGINPAALAVVLGMMSTYAFALPPAMTTVALGVGSGWTTTAQLGKYGFIILIPCVLFVGLVAYPIAALLI